MQTLPKFPHYQVAADGRTAASVPVGGSVPDATGTHAFGYVYEEAGDAEIESSQAREDVEVANGQDAETSVSDGNSQAQEQGNEALPGSESRPVIGQSVNTLPSGDTETRLPGETIQASIPDSTGSFSLSRFGSSPDPTVQISDGGGMTRDAEPGGRFESGIPAQILAGAVTTNQPGRGDAPIAPPTGADLQTLVWKAAPDDIPGVGKEAALVEGAQGKQEGIKGIPSFDPAQPSPQQTAKDESARNNWVRSAGFSEKPARAGVPEYGQSTPRPTPDDITLAEAGGASERDAKTRVAMARPGITSQGSLWLADAVPPKLSDQSLPIRETAPFGASGDQPALASREPRAFVAGLQALSAHSVRVVSPTVSGRAIEFVPGGFDQRMIATDESGFPATSAVAVPLEAASVARTGSQALTNPTIVIRQVADAMAAAKDQSIELTLDPPELGRVRMSMSEQNGILNVVIDSDQSTTQSLIRRHQEMLRQDLLALGYTGVSFAFDQGRQDNCKDNPPAFELASIEAAPDANDEIMLQSRETLAVSGVDIRV